MNHNIHLPIYDEKKSILFALGRNAIYAACKALGIESGDEVLTPAFDCDTSIQPFRVLGCRLRFFRSDPYTFSVDIDDIKRQITPKTKVIHIINHFGMPQPWDELLSLRQHTGIPILEDNAYSLFSKFNGRFFGTFGDMAIFSLRKNLPLIDGGLLRVNNPKYPITLDRKKSKWFYSTELGGVLNILKASSGYYKLPETLRNMNKRRASRHSIPPPLYSEEDKGYPDWPERDSLDRAFSCDYLRPISKIANIQLSCFSLNDYIEIMEHKRQGYMWLSERLAHVKGIKVLWPSLPEGAVPFCLSLLINSRRDRFLEELREKYDVMAWPTLSKEVLDRLKDFPDVELLGRQVLQINLRSEKVREKAFSRYMESIVKDINRLSKN